MDLFPLYNSIRIAGISTVITFFLGIASAYYINRVPKSMRGLVDMVFTIPLVLPPTVIGFFILRLLGPNTAIGGMFIKFFDIKLIMNWYSAIFATVIVTFPLMYRTVRGAFESFDMDILYAAQTLGKSNTWIFWKVLLPCNIDGILAGTVLSFSRALGEYGATSMVSGYTPGKTATISTTVYQLWRTGNESLAYKWVLINLVISAGVLIFINLKGSDNRSRI